jgi:hypothetical protein
VILELGANDMLRGIDPASTRQNLAGVVEKAQAAGEFRSDISPQFAAMAFYGAIEQVLTGWIFDSLPQSAGGFDEAKRLIVETICSGLDR